MARYGKQRPWSGFFLRAGGSFRQHCLQKFLFREVSNRSAVFSFFFFFINIPLQFPFIALREISWLFIRLVMNRNGRIAITVYRHFQRCFFPLMLVKCHFTHPSLSHPSYLPVISRSRARYVPISPSTRTYPQRRTEESSTSSGVSDRLSVSVSGPSSLAVSVRHGFNRHGS